MIAFHNDSHALHHGKLEMFRGALVPCFEIPARVDHVLAELLARGLGPVQRPPACDDAAIARVHAARYLEFLAGAWDEWVALDPANAQRDAIPSYWPIRTFRSDVLPAGVLSHKYLCSRWFVAGRRQGAGAGQYSAYWPVTVTRHAARYEPARRVRRLRGPRRPSGPGPDVQSGPGPASHR